MMEMITELQIDLYGETKFYAASAKQGDKATRYISVQLMNNGNEFQIPDDVILIANIKKPDGKFCYNECTKRDNRVIVQMTNQALAAAGTAYCDIEMRSENGELILSSAVFTIEIESSMRNENAIESSNEMTFIDRKFEIIERIRQEVKKTHDDFVEDKEKIDSHLISKENPHETNKEQIGLGNVDDTSDKDKPVSTAQQEALDAYYQQATGYTDQKIAALIGGAPSTLDTLGEIANAMQNNPDVVAALEDAIGSKASEAEFSSYKNVTDVLIGNTDISGVGDGTITGAITELKKSAADGKASVASAITAKGVPTAQDATFAELTENISLIGGGGNITLAGHPLKTATGYGNVTVTTSFSITDGKKYLIIATGGETNLHNSYDSITVELVVDQDTVGFPINSVVQTAPPVSGGMRISNMYYITDGTNQTVTCVTRAATWNGPDGSSKYGQAAYAEIIAFRLG